MTFDDLKKQVGDGAIDTVLACIVDMQGRLMGKRFHAQYFIDSAWQETHCCNYLLATDIEMATVEGYKASSWQAGYGDYIMQPDISTLRPVPWLEGTVMVLCDVLDHHTHTPVPHAPRQMLKKQVEKLAAMGYSANMATELEFFLFSQSYDEVRQNGFRALQPVSAYNEDYHILQTTKEEGVMRPLRNHLYAMGIPVEGSKGEAEAGQEELNIHYAEAMACADHHTLAKHAVKEIAWQQGIAATFLSKWDQNRVGSASHVHQSLVRDGAAAFHDPDAEYGMSKTMQHYLAGLIQYAADYTVFLAPYINSYKRFAKGTFAPTKIVWSVDNRTAGFRLCAADSPAVRIECRIGGSDMNPYLAMAAMLAAGIQGIEDELPLAPPATGDTYHDEKSTELPGSLLAATKALRESTMLRNAMGDDVVTHYCRAAEWEQEEFDRVVTDWEISRGFERA